jgi:uncharacterized membrane protein
VEHTESITIDRPANEVWDVVGDVRHWPDWSADLSDFEIEADELATGVEMTYKYRGRPARAAVTAYDEGRRIAIGATEKSWIFDESITVTPDGSQSEVEFSIGFEPTAGWAKAAAMVLSPFKGPLLANPVKRELQALKDRLEQ